MKKRILSVLLAIVMVSTLLPTAAFAAETTYNLYVSGVQVTDSNKDDLVTAINRAANATIATGVATFEPTTNTLTLDNFTYECVEEKDMISSTNLTELNIVLKGTNTIKGKVRYGIRLQESGANLIIRGDTEDNNPGVLNVSSRLNAINMNTGTLALYDVTLNVSSGENALSYVDGLVICNSTIELRTNGYYACYRMREDVNFVDGVDNYTVYEGNSYTNYWPVTDAYKADSSTYAGHHYIKIEPLPRHAISLTTSGPSNAGVITYSESAAEGSKVSVTVSLSSGYEVESVTVTKDSGGTVDVSGPDEYEAYTFTMPDEAVTVSVTFRLIHQHILCQTNGCTLDHNGDADGVGHDAVHFVPVSTQEDLQNAANSGGSVYLTGAIELTAPLTVSQNLSLCLNGYDLIYNGADSVIIVSNSKTLNITDCGSTGTITDSTGTYGAVQNGAGTFNLYAGTITGNKCGVYNSGTFNMSGGKIAGNTGNGVWNIEDFYMNGGEISGNGGDGVHTTGFFTMNDGEISGNSGDGVYTTGVFTMNGGKITGNDRGVMYDNGIVSVSGAPVINGNTNGNFCDYQTDYYLTVIAPLTDKADIGVTLAEKFGEVAGPSLYDDTLPAASNYTECFHSDEGYEVYDEGDWILIGNKITEQPNAENNYTVETNDDANARYQWYSVRTDEVTVTYDFLDEQDIGFDWMYGGNFDSETNKWAPKLYGSTGGYGYLFVALAAGETFTAEFDSALPAGYIVFMDDWVNENTIQATLQNGNTYALTATETGIYVLAVAEGGEEPVALSEAVIPNVICKTNVQGYTPVDGQITATLNTTGLENGTYACQVTWDYLGTPDNSSDDYTLTSAPVEYTAPVYFDPAYPVVENKGEDPDGTVKLSSNYSTPGSTVTVTVTPDKYYGVEKVIVRNASGKEIETTKNADGTYSFKMPYGKVTVEAVYVWENPFVDVVEDTFYIDAVEWALKYGITEGTSETTFSPVASCTRAQMVTFLWRAAGCPEPSSAVCAFTDVNMDSYYGKAVLWAIENGITNGTSATTFDPDAECSRAQMAAFLCRMAGGKAESDENAFVDVKADAYYADSVQWAVENGITEGTGEGMYSPDAVCTRGQMVTFLYRYYVK